MSPARKPARGGARPGAGRKRRADGVTSNKSIRLSPEENAVLAALTELLGEDSEAETLRRGFRELAERHGLI